eukprot:6191277-Pleurochrysis_carterae.AAC.2
MQEGTTQRRMEMDNLWVSPRYPNKGQFNNDKNCDGKTARGDDPLQRSLIGRCHLHPQSMAAHPEAQSHASSQTTRIPLRA